jgi:membrane protein
LFAAFGFEFAKYGFRLYVTTVPTYQMVYGALSALPLFLVWIYVSWVVVLVGAAVTATLAEGGSRRNARRRR